MSAEQCEGGMHVHPETVVRSALFDEAYHETNLGQPMLACLRDPSVPIQTKLGEACTIELLRDPPPYFEAGHLFEQDCRRCGKHVFVRIGVLPSDT